MIFVIAVIAKVNVSVKNVKKTKNTWKSLNMKINEKGIKLIMDFEGLALKAYYDIGGVLTIGYGHTGKVYPDEVITQQEAQALLTADISAKTHVVSTYITSKLNDNQFSALVSFAYNLGVFALKRSHLLKYVNEGSFETAANEFLKWANVNGRPVEGLMRRREAERTLFLDKEGI